MNQSNASNGKPLNSQIAKAKPELLDSLKRQGQDQKNPAKKLTKGGK